MARAHGYVRHGMSNPYEAEVPAYIEPGYGQRLKNARLRRGITTQPQMAQLVGCSTQTIWRHEHEEVIPTREMISKYARVLNVSEGYIVMGEARGHRDLPPAVVAFLKDESSRHLLEDTRARLRRLQWDLLSASEIDGKDVAAIAVMIDANLRDGLNTPHGPHEGASAMAAVDHPVHPR